MASSRGPVQEHSPQAELRRPVYLVLALLALSLGGLQVCAEGYEIIQAVRDPFFADRTTEGMAELPRLVRVARLSAFADYSTRMVPVGAMKLLLGGALMYFTVRGFFRRSSTQLLLQVTIANMVALLVSYPLYAPVRAAMVGAFRNSSEPETARLADLVPLFFAIGLVIQLATLGMCAFGLTRPAARAALEPATETMSGEG